MRRSVSRKLQLVMGGAIWVALVIAVIAGWEEVRGELAEAGTRFPISVLLIAVGVVAGARGWSVLRPAESQRRSMIGFLAAQPAKYLPVGGAMQAVSQVGLSLSEDSKKSDVAWSFVIHAAIQVAAASLVALLILGNSDTSTGVKAGVVAVAMLSVVCVRRSVVRRIIDRLTKMIPRLPTRGLVPETETLWRSMAWTTVPFLLSGTAFGLLLEGWSDPLAILTTTGVFAISWLIGFLVFPLPSGVGAREAILLLLLPGLPAAQVLGVSLAHRFSTIVAELILLSAVSRSAFVKVERRK